MAAQSYYNAATKQYESQQGSAGAALTKPSMTGAFATGTLTSGTAVIVPMAGAPLPATVWTQPVAGDTVTVSYSTDGGVNYSVWPSGAVTAYAKDSLLSGVTHIKFQRTAGAGITSTYGVC